MGDKKLLIPANCALIPGRFQPFHKGHEELGRAALKEHEAVVYLIRDRRGIEPWSPDEIGLQIKAAFGPLYRKSVFWFRVPDFRTLIYGRDVGYGIKRIDLPEDLEAISGTTIRKEQGK